MAKLFFLFTFLVLGSALAQTKTASSGPRLIAQDSVKKNYDPNRPATAALYSAVLPGLGQLYNKKYWKVPLVYGAIGGGVAFYINNNKEYNRLRDAFKIRLDGRTNDEFSNPDGSPIITTSGLERAQKVAQRNRELNLLIIAGIYIIQVIDANVDGHLQDFNVDTNLSILPYLDYNQMNIGGSYGLSIAYQF